MNKAVFISLEGTLVKTKSGKDYPINEDDWEFISGVLPKLHYMTDLGFIVCIVSNQGGIGSGKTTAKEVDARLKKIDDELSQYLGTGVNNAYCPYLESYFRKPSPGMAYNFALHLELSLRKSIMVGNSTTDSHFAKEAHIGTYFDVDSFINTDLTVYTW